MSEVEYPSSATERKEPEESLSIDGREMILTQVVIMVAEVDHGLMILLRP